MSKHFNRLTPAEAERITLLMEECAEVIHMCGKILRHGYASTHPDSPDGPDNRRLLEIEVGHVEAALHMMCKRKDIDVLGQVREDCEDKLENVQQYLHHQ